MKIVGRDVTVYSYNLAGMDANGPTNAAAGAYSSLIGRWESAEVVFEKDWADVTSSDATEPEARKTLDHWSATLRGIVDQAGSGALLAAANTDYVFFTFQDVVSGKTVNMRGGINRAALQAGKDKFTDDLQIRSVGRLGGGLSFSYG